MTVLLISQMGVTEYTTMCMKRSNNCCFQVLHNWPHYAVLVDERDRPGSHLTYVVQEDLELMKNTEVSLL